MAKVKGAILSIGASGSIAKTQVYASWKGVQYARQHVIPYNPDTDGQKAIRGLFAALQALYQRLPLGAQAPWEGATAGRPLTPRNLLTSRNVVALKGQVDMEKFVGSPGCRGGLPLTSLAVAGGASGGTLQVTFQTPSGPEDWTLQSVDVVLFQDRAPGTLPTDWPVFVSQSDVIPEQDVTVTVEDLEPGTKYIVSAWSVWVRPKGGLAYGPSLTVLGTATVGG